ncbi:MAG: glutamate dehydrogenase, partial [Anaerolineales bacterium]
VQSLQSFFWSDEEINQRLERIMVSAFHAVMAEAENRKIERRVAAQVLGIDRVVKATELRGIYP